MDDEQWQELDARLKKAFDEIKASCSKARKHGRLSSGDELPADGDLASGDGLGAAADAATDATAIDAERVDCDRFEGELNQAEAVSKRCDKSQSAN